MEHEPTVDVMVALASDASDAPAGPACPHDVTFHEAMLMPVATSNVRYAASIAWEIANADGDDTSDSPVTHMPSPDTLARVPSGSVCVYQQLGNRPMRLGDIAIVREPHDLGAHVLVARPDGWEPMMLTPRVHMSDPNLPWSAAFLAHAEHRLAENVPTS